MSSSTIPIKGTHQSKLGRLKWRWGYCHCNVKPSLLPCHMCKGPNIAVWLFTLGSWWNSSSRWWCAVRAEQVGSQFGYPRWRSCRTGFLGPPILQVAQMIQRFFFGGGATHMFQTWKYRFSIQCMVVTQVGLPHHPAERVCDVGASYFFGYPGS